MTEKKKKNLNEGKVNGNTKRSVLFHRMKRTINCMYPAFCNNSKML